MSITVIVFQTRQISCSGTGEVFGRSKVSQSIGMLVKCCISNIVILQQGMVIKKGKIYTLAKVASDTKHWSTTGYSHWMECQSSRVILPFPSPDQYLTSLLLQFTSAQLHSWVETVNMTIKWLELILLPLNPNAYALAMWSLHLPQGKVAKHTFNLRS